MNRTEFLKVLKEKGVEFYRHGSRHDIYIHIASGKKVAIPRHGEIKNKFINLLLKELFHKSSLRAPLAILMLVYYTAYSPANCNLLKTQTTAAAMYPHRREDGAGALGLRACPKMNPRR